MAPRMSDTGHAEGACSVGYSTGDGDRDQRERSMEQAPCSLERSVGTCRDERDRTLEHPSPVGPRITLAAAISLFALVLYLPGIGVGDFVGDDEALDAGVVWEMRQTGDWLFPEFNGEYLPPKPPLFYWAAAAVSKVRGRVDEVSLRVPSALAGAATVGITVAGTAPIVGLGPATLAGLLLATMAIIVRQSPLGL